MAAVDVLVGVDEPLAQKRRTSLRFVESLESMRYVALLLKALPGAAVALAHANVTTPTCEPENDPHALVLPLETVFALETSLAKYEAVINALRESPSFSSARPMMRREEMNDIASGAAMIPRMAMAVMSSTS